MTTPLEDRELVSGLDLGKLRDPSAFALFDRRRLQRPKGEVRIVEEPGYGRQTIITPQQPRLIPSVTKKDKHSWRYRLARMKRWEIGTSYEAILEWLVKAYSRPVEQGGLAGTTLAIDYTGVGVAVVEWLVKELRLAKARANIRPIWIQGGKKFAENDAGGWNVPKKELVGVLQMLMGTGRLTIDSTIENCRELVKELENFKEKIRTDTGNSSYEAWRETDHDDMVLAVAIILWTGEFGQKEPWIK